MSQRANFLQNADYVLLITMVKHAEYSTHKEKYIILRRLIVIKLFLYLLHSFYTQKTYKYV